MEMNLKCGQLPCKRTGLLLVPAINRMSVPVPCWRGKRRGCTDQLLSLLLRVMSGPCPDVPWVFRFQRNFMMAASGKRLRMEEQKMA